MDRQLAQTSAEGLLAHKDRIAVMVTDAMYAELPELLQRYGDVGRTRCLEDMRYNVEHLAPAVALGDARLFTQYVTWLRDMLGARNIPARDVHRSLQLMRTAVHDILPAEEADTAAHIIDAGIEVVS